MVTTISFSMQAPTRPLLDGGVNQFTIHQAKLGLLSNTPDPWTAPQVQPNPILIHLFVDQLLYFK